jgi:hypothetical protein
LLPNTNDAFQELVSANTDLSVSMHAMYMLRRFRSLGILAEYIQKDGAFAYLRVPANDGARLEIRPHSTRINDVVTTQPLMEWNEYPEPIRAIMEKAGKATGFYRYNAHIELIVDDYDPEYPDRQTLASEDGPCELASFNFGSSDFQQFIFGAIFHIKEETGFEVYPDFRRSRVAL